MINFLKKYIDGTHSIVKTQNGKAHITKKIVYFSFGEKESPQAVIYSSRNKQANQYLEKSIDNIMANGDLAPKIMFQDYYEGILFCGVEYAAGRKMSLANQSDFHRVVNLLIDRHRAGLPQHGDFQDNNIFISDSKVTVIDWDDYGQISWPLFDFYTLYFKYLRKVGHDEFIDSQKRRFFEAVNAIENEEEAKMLYDRFDKERKSKLRVRN